MSVTEQHDAISLTVLRQDGSLAASLTDTRLIAKLAHCSLPEALLRNLQGDVQELLACCADSGLGKVLRTDASARVRTLGKRIFDTLLPEPVGSFLRGSPARMVSLQLDATLAWAPWELAFDGESFFGEKFAVCRQIVTDDQVPRREPPLPNRGALNVLVLGDEVPHAAGESAAQRLINRLRMVEGLEVIGANAIDLRRDDLLPLIGESHVVHYVGPVDGRAAGWREWELLDARWIASLPAGPPFLISQNTAPPGLTVQPSGNRALAASACRRGLSILICESDRENDDGLEFLLEAYRQLAHGAALGQSIRAARSEQHQRFGVADVARLQAELYGDGRLVILERDMTSRVEDNLRQVTVMSFDLVGSTRLLATLGAE